MVTLASWKGEALQAVLGFLPDWIQWPVLGLVVAAVVGSWAMRLKRGISRRRAGVPGGAHPVTGREQERGADYLGEYAPRQASAPEPRGADFLGEYAPQARQEGGSS